MIAKIRISSYYKRNMKKVFLINLSFFISEYFIASSASLADVPICLLKTHWTILLLNISER